MSRRNKNAVAALTVTITLHSDGTAGNSWKEEAFDGSVDIHLFRPRFLILLEKAISRMKSLSEKAES